MRHVHRALPLTILATSIALTGCGGMTKDAGTASVPTESKDAAVVLRAPASDGRTGEAVTSMEAGPLRELSRGGASDPSEPRRGAGRRDGVAAGDACADGDLMPESGNLDRIEASTFCLVNAQRADNGLAPLRRNAQLAEAGRGHVEDMVANSYFAHEGRDGSDIRDRIGDTGYIPTAARWTIGENLAWGTGVLATPRAIVNAWMNSPGHRANILHTSYREMGFSIVVGNPKRTDGVGATYANEFGVRGDDRTGVAEPAPASSGASTAPVSTQAPAAAVKGKRVDRGRSSKAKRAKAKRARAARAKRARAAKARAAKAQRARAARLR